MQDFIVLFRDYRTDAKRISVVEAASSEEAIAKATELYEADFEQGYMYFAMDVSLVKAAGYLAIAP